MHATTEWSRGLDIEVRGDDVVSRTGNVITRMLADKTGLTTEMSDALIRPDVTHDRGAVMRDLAVAIADGASCVSEIAVLGDQSRLFGPVASTSTLWRTLNELDAKALQRLVQARNKVRATVWALIEARHGAVPPVRTAYGDIDGMICIRIDATLRHPGQRQSRLELGLAEGAIGASRDSVRHPAWVAGRFSFRRGWRRC
jgi:hypothetical protein